MKIKNQIPIFSNMVELLIYLKTFKAFLFMNLKKKKKSKLSSLCINNLYLSKKKNLFKSSSFLHHSKT